MKCLPVLFMLCLAPAGVLAQTGPPPEFEEVRRALEQADVDGVLAHAGERIEIGLFGAVRTYSRSQAGFVLESLFDAHPPDSIAIDRMTGTESGWFASASYRTTSQSESRLYLRLRLEGESWRLREIVVREGA